ncbi:MAG TPA: hypothetical protein VJ720_07405 [Chitinophaga sp.]|nr:hypothetical protein [Chitinophaga sp.]
MGNQTVINSINAGITIEKVLYTGKTHVIGGREGMALSDDGRLQTKLSTPGGPGIQINIVI